MTVQLINKDENPNFQGLVSFLVDGNEAFFLNTSKNWSLNIF